VWGQGVSGEGPDFVGVGVGVPPSGSPPPSGSVWFGARLCFLGGGRLILFVTWVC
jgi:hypothetical protein